MRGSDAVSGRLFSYVDLEKRVPADHPLRIIREIVNTTLLTMSAEFDALYSPFGRESVPPERLLRALLLQAFYTIRSERQLVERIDFDLLFRWFVGLGMDDPVWDATSFTKNRDRLLAGEVAAGSSPPCCRSRRSRRCCRTSISRWTARCWRLGRARRAFGQRMAQARPPLRAAMASRTSTAKGAATRRMPRPQTRTRGCTRRGTARKRSSASWAMH